MIINGALLLLVRSVSLALLAMVGSQWVLVYLVSDMGFYFTYKILRRDFWHWIPLEGAAELVVTVMERLVVKVLVSFTGVLQLRAAGEMGGCYWTFEMVRAERQACATTKTTQIINCSLSPLRARSWHSLPRSYPPTSTTQASGRARRRSWKKDLPGRSSEP
jgi:hypothetical protein